MADHDKEARRRSRSKDRDRERDRERDRDRDRDRDCDRDRKRRSRSRSRSKERRSHRGRSRSRSRERAPRRERKTGFDKGPTGELAPPVPVAQLPAFAGLAGGVPVGFGGMPGLPPMQMGAPLPAAAMTQQATRHARRIYLGGLPPTVEEVPLATLFNQAMHTIGGVVGPGDSVVNVYINQEKKFAFVEFRSVEECSNAMALDGILYDGVPIRVRRPNDYNPVVAASLGPSQPSASLNLAALGLAPGGGGGHAADGPDRIFVGGLPYFLTEPQVRELLEAFGPLRALDIIRDKETGNSKGYAFCVYADPAVTDMACAGLNGMAMGDKTLTVRRASAMGQPKVDAPPGMMVAQQVAAMQLLAGGVGLSGIPGMPLPMPPFGAHVAPLAPEPPPTHVLVLDNVVTVDELRDDAEFADIEEDMREECAKFGEIQALRIPRPLADAAAPPPPGVGRVYVRYAAPEHAARARAALHGRKFGGNAVVAAYFDEGRFDAGEL